MASLAYNEILGLLKKGLADQRGRITRDEMKTICLASGVSAAKFDKGWRGYQAYSSSFVYCEDFLRWIYNDVALEEEKLRADPRASDAIEVQAFLEKAAHFERMLDLKPPLSNLFVAKVSALRDSLKNVIGVNARPDFLPKDGDISNTMKNMQKEHPERWTLTIVQWLQVIDHIKKHPKYMTIREKGKRETVRDEGKRGLLRPVNMYKVTDLFIKPWTAGTGCGLSVLMSRGASGPAKLMLSHAWGEDMEELLQCVDKHVKAKELNTSASLWFCCFANYQAEDDQEVSIKAQLKLKPFASVIQQLKDDTASYGLLAIHTTTEDMYGRLWCVYEIDQANRNGVKVEFSVSDNFAEAVVEKMELYHECGVTKKTFDLASGLRINTAAAKCSRQEDYVWITKEILKDHPNGLEELDSQIEQFRKDVLSPIFFEACKRKPKFLALVEDKVMLKVLRDLGPTCLTDFPAKNWKNAKFSGAALRVRPDAWEYVKQHVLWKDEFVIEMMKEVFGTLNYAAEIREIDRECEVVLEAAMKYKSIALDIVSKDGKNLQHAVELRRDREVVIKAVEQDSDALQYAADNLRADPDVVLQAVQTGARLDKAGLDHASKALRDDKEFVLSAIKHNGLALKAAPIALKSDRDIVLEAVRKAGKALQFLVEDDAETATREELTLWEEREYKGQKYFLNRKEQKEVDIDPIPELKERLKQYEQMRKWRGDKEVVFAAVEQNGLALAYASYEWRCDQALVQVAIKQNGLALEHVQGKLRADEKVVREAIMQDWRALQYAPDSLRNIRALVQVAIKQDRGALEFASEEVHVIVDILEALPKDENKLKELTGALENMRADQEFMLEAVKQNGKALYFALGGLKENKEIVQEAVKQNGNALKFASKELRNMRDVVLEAVRQEGGALVYADDKLKEDRQLVLVAIKQRGASLHYAADSLRNDKEFVREAVGLNGLALYGASNELRNDPEIVLAAIRQNPMALERAADMLKDREDFMLQAIEHGGKSLKDASERLRGNRELVLEAVRRDGGALKYASEALRKEPEVVLAAMKQNLYALQYASSDLRCHRDFLKEAARQDAFALFGASEESRGDRELALEVVERNGWALQFASQELRDDKRVVTAAVEQDGAALRYASVEMRANLAVVLAAVRQNKKAIEFASKELRVHPEVLQAVKRPLGPAEVGCWPSGLTYEIYIQGTYKDFGIIERDLVDEKYLLVTFSRGLISEWNRSHEDLKVQAGDLIMRVNGRTSSAEALAMELTECNEAHIVFMRRA